MWVALGITGIQKYGIIENSYVFTVSEKPLIYSLASLHMGTISW